MLNAMQVNFSSADVLPISQHAVSNLHFQALKLVDDVAPYDNFVHKNVDSAAFLEKA